MQKSGRPRVQLKKKLIKARGGYANNVLMREGANEVGGES